MSVRRRRRTGMVRLEEIARQCNRNTETGCMPLAEYDMALD
jgi:hypothetical protein